MEKIPNPENLKLVDTIILNGVVGYCATHDDNDETIGVIEQGLPVIIIEQYIPGIAAYIESIEQEVTMQYFVLYGTTRFLATLAMPIFSGGIDGKRIRTNRPTRCAARVYPFVLIMP